jgi:hypothetical protein
MIFMLCVSFIAMFVCGLSATSQHYFSLRTNQPPAIRQQHFSLRTNQPPAKGTGLHDWIN